MAATNEAEKKKNEGASGDDQGTENRTWAANISCPMGFIVRMASWAKLSERTGFDEADISFLWDAFRSMFEHDRSAARGEMAARKPVAFEHSSALGNAPAHELFSESLLTA